MLGKFLVALVTTARKALLAAVGAATTGLGAVFSDGKVTQAEITWVVVLAVFAGLAVFGVKNLDAGEKPSDAVQPNVPLDE